MRTTKKMGMLLAGVLAIAAVACGESTTGEGGSPGTGEANVTESCLTCRIAMNRSMCGVTFGMTQDEVEDVRARRSAPFRRRAILSASAR